MGELFSGNFNQPKKDRPLNPFKKNEVARVAFGEPFFSASGVVEYKRGVRPKNSNEVIDRVNFHVDAMEKTILSIFPNLKGVEISTKSKKELHDISDLELVEFLDGSKMEHWIDSEEDALLHLAVISEVRFRDLDIEY